MSAPVVALISDFGLKDSYVGIMKGVVLSTCPDAKIIDICHEVPPQNIIAGAYLLSSAMATLPDNTVIVGVVDPGVGGKDRRSIAVETDHHVFVGPDNGLFELALDRHKPRKCIHLTNSDYHQEDVNSTFHGRDIFSSVGAHIANGVPLDELGEPFSADELVRLPESNPLWGDGRVECHVIHVDRFGNLITNLTRERAENWLGGAEVEITFDGRQIPLMKTFSEAVTGRPLAYFGSSDRLEIAVRNGNAAQQFHAGQGSTIILNKVD